MCVYDSTHTLNYIHTIYILNGICTCRCYGLCCFCLYFIFLFLCYDMLDSYTNNVQLHRIYFSLLLFILRWGYRATLDSIFVVRWANQTNICVHRVACRSIKLTLCHAYTLTQHSIEKRRPNGVCERARTIKTVCHHINSIQFKMFIVDRLM